MNLWQKLTTISEAIGAIEKSGRNTNFNYNFIEQSRVVGELRPLLAKHGVAILPKQAVSEQSDVTNSKGNTQTKTILTVVWKVVNTEKPDECEEITWQSEALDTQDKGLNKAQTANEKTFLMKLFHISDYDPDEDADQPAPAKQAQPAKQPARTGPDWENLKRGYSAATTMSAIEAIDTGLKALKLPDSPEKRALWKHREACVDRIKQVTTADRAGK